jgi:hypothetical protein
MPRFSTSFNFGANAAKPRKPRAGGKKRGGKSDAWRAYVGTSRRKR